MHTMYGFGVLVWTLRVEQECCGTTFILCSQNIMINRLPAPEGPQGDAPQATQPQKRLYVRM